MSLPRLKYDTKRFLTRVVLPDIYFSSYLQIHVLTYLIKLHIELTLVDMMSRIVQATNPLNTFDLTTAPTSE